MNRASISSHQPSPTPSSSPHESSVERQIHNADNDGRKRKNARRNVRIDELIQIMQQESALVRLDSGPLFQPIFQQGQRTRPRQNLRKDPPDKRSNVQSPEKRARARQKSAKDNPYDEEYVHEKHERCEHGIKATGNDNSTHARKLYAAASRKLQG